MQVKILKWTEPQVIKKRLRDLYHFAQFVSDKFFFQICLNPDGLGGIFILKLFSFRFYNPIHRMLIVYLKNLTPLTLWLKMHLKSFYSAREDTERTEYNKVLVA